MFNRFKKIFFGLLLAGLIWCIIAATLIGEYGTRDHAIKSDCIIVLGAAVNGNSPSPVFEERIRHGINLYNAGYGTKLVFTGGIGEGDRHSEAGVARLVATRHLIPASDILIEERSKTTLQNLSEADALMRKHGLKSAIIVSDPLHMKRAIIMVDGLNINAVSSPTPTTRYRSVQTKLGFLLRELYFLHHYVITGN